MFEVQTNLMCFIVQNSFPCQIPKKTSSFFTFPLCLALWRNAIAPQLMLSLSLVASPCRIDRSRCQLDSMQLTFQLIYSFLLRSNGSVSLQLKLCLLSEGCCSAKLVLKLFPSFFQSTRNGFYSCKPLIINDPSAFKLEIVSMMRDSLFVRSQKYVRLLERPARDTTPLHNLYLLKWLA